MARNDPTIYMRIPAELKEKLDAAAEENRRSMTAEVVARLQATFDETVVTTVEARVRPGAEEKRFEFNADEIADKVVERLEGRNKAKSPPNRVIMVGNYGRSPDERTAFDNLYASMMGGVNRVILGSSAQEFKPRGNVPYGPQKSENAPKSLPKKARGKKA